MVKICPICDAPLYRLGRYRKSWYHTPEEKERCPAYDPRREKVLARTRAYFKSSRFPVIDCFEKDKPVTLETLCQRSGGGKGFVLIALKEYQKVGLVVKLDEKLFRLNANSSHRMAVDGYFHEQEQNQQKSTEKKQRPQPH